MLSRQYILRYLESCRVNVSFLRGSTFRLRIGVVTRRLIFSNAHADAHADALSCWLLTTYDMQRHMTVYPALHISLSNLDQIHLNLFLGPA
jgi:hypothetical protein